MKRIKKSTAIQFSIFILMLLGIGLCEKFLALGIIIVLASFVLGFIFARRYSESLMNSPVTILDEILFIYVVFGLTCYENYLGIEENTQWMLIVMIAFGVLETFTAYCHEGVFKKSIKNTDRCIMTAVVIGWTSFWLVASSIFVIYTRYDFNAYLFAGTSMLSALGLLWILLTSNYRTPSVKRQMQFSKFGFVGIVICFMVEYLDVVTIPPIMLLLFMSVFILDLSRYLYERLFQNRNEIR